MITARRATTRLRVSPSASCYLTRPASSRTSIPRRTLIGRIHSHPLEDRAGGCWQRERGSMINYYVYILQTKKRSTRKGANSREGRLESVFAQLYDLPIPVIGNCLRAAEFFLSYPFLCTPVYSLRFQDGRTVYN